MTRQSPLNAASFSFRSRTNVRPSHQSPQYLSCREKGRCNIAISHNGSMRSTERVRRQRLRSSPGVLYRAASPRNRHRLRDVQGGSPTPTTFRCAEETKIYRKGTGQAAHKREHTPLAYGGQGCSCGARVAIISNIPIRELLLVAAILHYITVCAQF